MYSSRRWLAPLALSVAMAGVALPVADAAPTEAGRIAVVGLQGRLESMDALLDRIAREKRDTPAQALMRRHWEALQGYMGASLALARTEPAARLAPDCRYADAKWENLPFPDGTTTGAYVADQRALSKLMHRELDQMRAAGDSAELQQLATAHWNGNFRYLETESGFAWMFGSAMPESGDGGASQGQPSSPDAELVGRVCSQCHAAPSPAWRLRTEWRGDIASMVRHMELSDASVRVCVTLPTDDELRRIRDYYVRRAP